MNSFDQNPLPAVGVSAVVFNEQGEVLLICRDKAPAFGQWSIPGGKQEPGESLTEACKREIYEETGLDVEVKHIIAVVERRVEQFHYIIIDFLAEMSPNCTRLPVAQSDVSEARWISVAELNNFNLVDGLAEIIGRAYRYYQQGLDAGLLDIEGKRTDFIVN